MGGGAAVNGVLLTPLKRIATPKGDVLHGIKATDPGFAGFGEAYFSIVLEGATKGWKRHRRMTLNLVCAAGAVQFVVHDGSGDPASMFSVVLAPSEARHRRLTVAPGLWVGFRGVGPGENIILNLASELHDPTEAEARELEAFPWPADRGA